MQNNQASNQIKVAAGVAWTTWELISALVALSLALVFAWKGRGGFDVVLVTGPFSKFWLTFLSVLMVWLLGGLALWLVKNGLINSGNALTWAGFFTVSLLYLNLLRERLQYGDLTSYILGATN